MVKRGIVVMTNWQNQMQQIVTKLQRIGKHFFASASILWLATYFAVAGTSSFALAEDTAEVQKAALQKVRSLLSARDLPGAKAARAEAAAVEGPIEFQNERARVETLYDVLEQFWVAVDKGGKSLGGGEELMIGEMPVAVVEYLNGSLTLRVAGANRSYTLKTLPPRLALELSYRALQKEAPVNQVLFGCFLMLDPKGDRKMARDYLTTAAKANVEAATYLMPELEILPPAPPIEIPAVTPMMKTLLNASSWMLRSEAEKGFTKKPLGDVGKNNDEGRLVVSFPGEGKHQLVTKRQFAGDFVFRAILVDVKQGMQFGAYAGDTRDISQTVELPEGTVLVEIERKQGVLSCKVNSTKVDLADSGEIPGRFSCVIGLGASEAAVVTVAAVDIQGR